MSLIVYLLDFQCAMCRAVLESGADQKAAESLTVSKDNRMQAK